jgi:hypothetical protein
MENPISTAAAVETKMVMTDTIRGKLLPGWLKSNFVELGQFGTHGVFDWFQAMVFRLFFAESFKQQKVIYDKVFSGFFDVTKTSLILDFIQKSRNGNLLALEDNVIETFHMFVGDDFVAYVSCERNFISVKFGISVDLQSDTRDPLLLFKNEIEFFAKELSPREKTNEGNVYVLATDYEGLDVKKLGFAASRFEKENYAPDVQVGMEAILSDLKSANPKGKLTIIEGDPGSGKTFFVRSLVSETPNACFIVIPPNMVERISDPAIIPVFLRLKSGDQPQESYGPSGQPVSKTDIVLPLISESEKKEAFINPIILIVEDADECLVRRNGGNMPAISAVLNLTSGILGDLLDIRVVATTNAKKTDMDEALLRDGRLSYNLEVGRLPPEQATKIYRRLMNNDSAEYPHKNEPVLLASIYAQAKVSLQKEKQLNAGEEVEKTVETTNKSSTSPSRKIGFG